MFCFDLVLHPINAELEKKISPKSFSFERDESKYNLASNLLSKLFISNA
jgi:hypothetical protein